MADVVAVEAASKSLLSHTGTKVVRHVTCSPADTQLGVFIARGKEDVLVTRNLVPGEAVYGEKRISVGVSQDAIVLND